ncbi:hypothetical protein [Nocardioides sp. CFH 31398]|uniref:hypothetical protein n=1 Tax=Nocardioides sp. CFH 31398 TaxID=2919579 RepID=UPI001F061758|nr:hypothetical protein [Nocardioides sp. CFH 31398]MCH1868424.1 hypothetical protein [Nocardioides sp. CFH 31398]
MESNETLRQELREAERGEALGWTGYRFPTWTPIAMAVWATTFTLGLYYLDGVLGNVWSLIHLAASFGYLWWDRRAQAAYPSYTGRMPREYNGPTIALFVSPLVLIPVTFLLGYYVAGWVAAVFIGSAWGLTVSLYNRAYARASAAVKARLA